jgi:hypothetical protein
MIKIKSDKQVIGGYKHVLLRNILYLNYLITWFLVDVLFQSFNSDFDLKVIGGKKSMCLASAKLLLLRAGYSGISTQGLNLTARRFN